MYCAAFTGSESVLFIIIQGIIVIGLCSLLIGALFLRAHENRFWILPALLFTLGVLTFMLGNTLPYGIQVNQQDTIVDEPIEAEVVVRNPYPIPVWYPGFDWISFYSVSSNISSSYAQGPAVDVASSSMGRGIIPALGERKVYSRRFNWNETGSFDLNLLLKEGVRTVHITKTVEVKEAPLFIENIT